MTRESELVLAGLKVMCTVLFLVLLPRLAASQTIDPVGVWRYQSGGFTDTMTLRSDGQAASEHDPDNTGQWQMVGSTLVIRWKNGWTNRYLLGAGDGPFSGSDIDPDGVAHGGGQLSRTDRETNGGWFYPCVPDVDVILNEDGRVLTYGRVHHISFEQDRDRSTIIVLVAPPGEHRLQLSQVRELEFHCPENCQARPAD